MFFIISIVIIFAFYITLNFFINFTSGVIKTIENNWEYEEEKDISAVDIKEIKTNKDN